MNPGYPPYPSSQSGESRSSIPGFYQNQSGFCAEYPQNAGYPSQSGGYPPQSGGGYFPQPGFPSNNSYPTQSGYPPANTPGYPPANTPGYPPTNTPGYPPANTPGYPPANTPGYSPQSGYPSTPVYPPAGSYPQQQGHLTYPNQPAGYPPSSGYPAQTPSYMNQSVLSCPGKPAYSSSSSYSTQNYCPTGGYAAQVAGQYQEQLNPTVRPANPFDARQDAEILRKAMKGFGTDEKAIINVLSKRSNRQRLEIAFQFKSMYGKDLISDLKSELSGKFEDLVVALMTPLPEYLAKEIYHAIEGIGTNEETLVEILCTASNAEIYGIRDAYQRYYGRSLENDLSSDTSGHFRRLLVSIVQGRRSENNVVEEAAAARDAQALMSAGVLMLGTDESTFNAILCTRSYPHLRRVLMEYQRLSGHTLEQAIKDEFSGDIKTGLLAIIRCVENKAGFFAQRIRDAVACAGTKDRQLIRVIVSRCEIDMQNIKRAYQQFYGKSVEQDISDDTSGDYKKMLLALVSG